MKKTIFIFMIIFFLFILTSFLMYENKKLKKQILQLTPSDEMLISTEIPELCREYTIDYTVSGNSMEPLLKNGQKIQVLDGYYRCNALVNRGDIIIYKKNDWEIVKQVRALPGDVIKFENTSMFINGEILKNSIWWIYIFSTKEIALLRAYLQNWILQEWTFFAFWDNLTNSIDSRKIWWLGIDNFVGKVILK